jgi:putative ABC transport system ATP-binding protein
MDVMELFNKYIKEHNAGMILVTHDEQLAHSCSQVYRLEDEKLIQIK